MTDKHTPIERAIWLGLPICDYIAVTQRILRKLDAAGYEVVPKERTTLVNEADLVCQHCGKGKKSHGAVNGGKGEIYPPELWCSDRPRTWTPVAPGDVKEWGESLKDGESVAGTFTVLNDFPKGPDAIRAAAGEPVLCRNCHREIRRNGPYTWLHAAGGRLWSIWCEPEKHTDPGEACTEAETAQPSEAPGEPVQVTEVESESHSWTRPYKPGEEQSWGDSVSVGGWLRPTVDSSDLEDLRKMAKSEGCGKKIRNEPCAAEPCCRGRTSTISELAHHVFKEILEWGAEQERQNATLYSPLIAAKLNDPKADGCVTCKGLPDAEQTNDLEDVWNSCPSCSRRVAHPPNKDWRKREDGGF